MTDEAEKDQFSWVGDGLIAEAGFMPNGGVSLRIILQPLGYPEKPTKPEDEKEWVKVCAEVDQRNIMLLHGFRLDMVRLLQ